jgi:hypothetical protein
VGNANGHWKLENDNLTLSVSEGPQVIIEVGNGFLVDLDGTLWTKNIQAAQDNPNFYLQNPKSYLLNQGFSVHDGSIALVSAQLVTSDTNTIMATTITNNGPGFVVKINCTIGNETVVQDFTSNPLKLHVQRGFVFTLHHVYEIDKQYHVTVTATFENGDTYTD